MAKQLIHTSEFYNHSDNLGNLAFTFHTFDKRQDTGNGMLIERERSDAWLCGERHGVILLHIITGGLTMGRKTTAHKESHKGNREYRSDVFSMLLMDPARALEVYNAINGTSYDDPEMVEIIPLENKGFSLSVRNDASFVLDANLSIYEHQSTLCPNMPLRSMIYFSQIIRGMIRNKNIYGSTQVKIPVPYFVVFYNGSDNAPEQYELRLSDAFEKKVEDPQIELICKVYNINAGNNAQIMEKCPTLREYMYFVDLVRKNFEENGYEDLEQAIEQSIDECIQKNVLKEFLKENRSEVTKVMQLDYTFERQLELEREAASEAASRAWEQGVERGIQRGLEQERLAMIRKMLAQGYDKQFIMQFGYTEEEYQKSMKK